MINVDSAFTIFKHNVFHFEKILTQKLTLSVVFKCIELYLQELIATGAANIFGSFFSCYPIAASVSRSSVQDSAGGKTQVMSMQNDGLSTFK